MHQQCRILYRRALRCGPGCRCPVNQSGGGRECISSAGCCSEHASRRASPGREALDAGVVRVQLSILPILYSTYPRASPGSLAGRERSLRTCGRTLSRRCADVSLSRPHSLFVCGRVSLTSALPFRVRTCLSHAHTRRPHPLSVCGSVSLTPTPSVLASHVRTAARQAPPRRHAPWRPAPPSPLRCPHSISLLLPPPHPGGGAHAELRNRREARQGIGRAGLT
jgi:hypothetical protein